MPAPGEKPNESGFAADAVLKDGAAIRLRAIRPDDRQRLLDLYERLSDRTIYYRFFTPPPLPINDAALDYLVNIDYDQRMAVVATLGGGAEEQVIAVGRWEVTPDDPTAAEIAFVVEDAHQGQGIATILLDELARLAPAHGIDMFVATVLADNRSMLKVFQRTGFRVTNEIEAGCYNIEFPIKPTRESLAAAETRERTSLAAAVAPVLHPKRVAIIGASRETTARSATMLRGLVGGSFVGTVHAVNSAGNSLASIPACLGVEELPDDIDLAVLAVPAQTVPEILDACGRKGVKAALIGVPGFTSQADLDMLREKVRAHGMRVVGPSSMGVINTNPLSRMQLTIAEVQVTPGVVGIAAQSGALGIALLDHLYSMRIGVSQFVDLGGRADLSSNDLLAFWENDEGTGVIVLYLERFGNPHTFARLARRISREKPIVCVASGAARAGKNALYRQCGLVRTENLEALLDVTALFSTQPVPRGNRVAVIANTPGAAALTAEACIEGGLVLAEFSARTQTELAHITRSTNPVELPFAPGSAVNYRRALNAVSSDPHVDCVLAIFVPNTRIEIDDVASAIVDASTHSSHVTFAACFMSAHGIPPMLRRRRTAVPSYVFPESAVRALAHAAEYGDRRRRPRGTYFDLEEGSLAAVRSAVDAHGAGRLGGDEARELVESAGISTNAAGRSLPFVLSLEQDGRFGTVLGLGRGLTRSAVDPEAYRIVPLTDVDAGLLVRQVLGEDTDADGEAMSDVLLRVSAIAQAGVRLFDADVELAVGAPGHGAAVVDSVFTLS